VGFDERTSEDVVVWASIIANSAANDAETGNGGAAGTLPG